MSAFTSTDDHDSFFNTVQSECSAQGFRSSSADESGDAEDFSFAQCEADGARFLSAGQSFHFEYRRADAMRLARIDLADFAADHESNNFRQGDGRCVSSSDAFTVAQHRV